MAEMTSDKAEARDDLRPVISFHDWKSGSAAVFFCYPADFTSVGLYHRPRQQVATIADVPEVGRP
ncbi:MAG: hypothetical protein ACI9N0_001294 [Ilumatobacter sp.]|jgi:hypothetical protein